MFSSGFWSTSKNNNNVKKSPWMYLPAGLVYGSVSK